MEAANYHTAIRIYYRSSAGNELSIDIPLAKVFHSKNYYLYYSIEAQCRLTTKLNNTELSKELKKKSCFP